MIGWRFEVSSNAENDLERVGEAVRTRILGKIKWFRDNFEQVQHFPLSGKWKEFFKLRVGDWRIVYEIEYKRRLVTIHSIDRRDKIYKRKKYKRCHGR